jgi:four helix bundle protein
MQDFKQRTFLFAVAVGKLINELPYNTVNKVYFNQLVKSSSSIGANYRAAKRAKSDPDFINKLKIAEEEADESVYFLELLQEFNPAFNDRITGLTNECTEILKIIVSSITTTRTRINKEKAK